MRDFHRDSDAGDESSIAGRIGLGASLRGNGAKKRKWWKKKRWWAVGLGLLAIVALVLFSGGPPKMDYTTQPVTRGDLKMTVSATGTLAPRVEVTVGAEVSGRIDALYVDYNSVVKKGQKLAQLNTESLQAQLDQYRALLAQSVATQKQKRADLERKTALYKGNALSKMDYEGAVGDYERAKATVDQYAAQVKNYETSLVKATIYAPIDGVVLERKVSVGQTVAASFSTPELFTIASDLREMELDVDIDEADVGQTRAGQAASFTVDAYADKTFTARLTQVRFASETVQNVVTYKGILQVDNPNLLLKPGMTATAEIITGQVSGAVLVPNAALRFAPPDAIAKAAPPAKPGAGHGRVWTKGEGGTLTPHDIEVGGSNGLFTVVKSGDIKPGDSVVTDSRAAGGGATVTVGH